MLGTSRSRRARHRRVRTTARCDAAARSHRTVSTLAETPDADTDGRLTEHRLESPLKLTGERGSETLRGTFGRGQLSVEARRTVSALDDSSGPSAGRATALDPRLLPGNDAGPAAVSDAAMHTVMRTLPAPERSPSRELLPDDPRTLVATRGVAAMSLNALDQAPGVPGSAPYAGSMRFMEAGLAFTSILVALLLSLAS